MTPVHVPASRLMLLYQRNVDRARRVTFVAGSNSDMEHLNSIAAGYFAAAADTCVPEAANEDDPFAFFRGLFLALATVSPFWMLAAWLAWRYL
ncbi:MAG: hypothetical protein WB608_16195 [Terracidiphilus sp.]